MLKRVVFLIFVLMCCVSTIFNIYKKDSLDFHRKDFPYYLQFGSKWLDPNLSPHVSLNPNGANFLGFYGAEATDSLHQAIHFEPIKYIEAPFMYLFDDPIVLFVIISVIFFAPICYLSIIFPVSSRLDSKFVLLISLAYCLYPAVLFLLSHDIRPFLFLSPLFSLASLSITFRRPMVEVFVMFNLMFLVREEALIFGLVSIMYAMATKFYAPNAEQIKIRPLVFSWLFWVLLIGSYFLWTGYPNKAVFLFDSQIIQVVSGQTNFVFMIPILLALIIIVGGAFVVIRKQEMITSKMPLISFSAIFIPLAWQYYVLFSGNDVSGIMNFWFYSPQIIIGFHSFLIILLLLWQGTSQIFHKNIILFSLSTIILASLILNTTGPDSALQQFFDYQERKKDADLVWQLVNSTNKYSTGILSDHKVYQAFHDYEYVYSFERLPRYITTKGSRSYPDNVADLQKIVETQIDFIVTTKANSKKVLPILAQTTVADQVRLVNKNNNYIIYQIVRPDSLTIKPRVDFGKAIRLVTSDLNRSEVMPGDHIDTTFYFQAIDSLDQNLNVLVRLIGRQGELLRVQGWPNELPTSNWQLNDVRLDRHELRLPADTPLGYYRIELSFYDPDPLVHLPVTDASTDHPLGDAYMVDYLVVGNIADRPANPLTSPANLGSSIRLLGTTIDSLDGVAVGKEGKLKIQLFWQSLTPVDTNYTVFVHLVGADGQLVSQQDQQPLGGFFPTGLWDPGQVIADDYHITVPGDAPLGSYELRVGMYDLATGQRLPVSQDGQAIGDYVSVGTTIQE